MGDEPVDVEPEPEQHGAPGSLMDWMFRNRHTGRITIAQLPNPQLSIFLVTVVARWVVAPRSTVRTTIDAVAVASLTAWAVDEVWRGVNPWRRLLGLIGCGFALAGVVSLTR